MYVLFTEKSLCLLVIKSWLVNVRSVYTYWIYLSQDCGISFITKNLKQSSKEVLESITPQLYPETSCCCTDDLVFSPCLVGFFNSIQLNPIQFNSIQLTSNALNYYTTYIYYYKLAQKFMAVGIAVLANSVVKMKFAIKNLTYVQHI